MANASVLVAGTGGITLLDSRGKDLGYPVRMDIGARTGGLIGRSARELIDLLSMEHVPGQIAPAKTTLVSGLSLRPGHVLKTAYNLIPDSYNRFLYDWRADLRHSGSQLADYLVERKPAGGRWNVVGHSQGGLLIVLASKRIAERRQFASVVRSVALVGTPLAGTVNAARALVQGSVMGKAAEGAFQRIVRTWPSIYQMLPSWNAVADRDGRPMATSLLDDACWNGHAGISADLLVRAREARALLQEPFAAMTGDVNLAILMARTRETPILLQHDGALTATASATEPGDTLVPHAHTLRWLGADARFTKTLTGPIREHSFLLCDPAVWAGIRRALS